MEKSKERKFMCKFCSKKFPSGKSLGGHIRIHTNENSVDSDRYNGNRLREKPKKNKISALKQEQLVRCRECDKEFDSLKALCNHSEREKIVMDSQSDTETSSSPTRKRSKRVIKQSNSESFSYGSSFSASEIEQEHKHMALSLMMMSRDHSFKNSVAESSENNSVILETKSCSGEQLKMFDAGDDNAYDSASDYFMNGPKKSGSEISVDGSLRNNSLKRFRNSGEGGSKYELRKSKRVFFSSYKTDSCAETNSMVKKASGAKKKSNHHCPICSRVFKSGQALGGHKRSHFIGNQEHIAEMHSDPIDLNLPAPDIDE